jgi:hypothetical protein
MFFVSILGGFFMELRLPLSTQNELFFEALIRHNPNTTYSKGPIWLTLEADDEKGVIVHEDLVTNYFKGCTLEDFIKDVLNQNTDLKRKNGNNKGPQVQLVSKITKKRLNARVSQEADDALRKYSAKYGLSKNKAVEKMILEVTKKEVF